jgi:methyltransferase
MPPTDILFLSLVILTILQRLLELRRSRLNQASLGTTGFTRIDSPASYWVMVSVHTLWFIAMLVEHTVNPRTLPVSVIAIALTVFLCAQLLRLAVMRALGSQWNTQIMAPTGPRNDPGVVTSGPYRYIRHPNYLAVILEFVSLPLIGGAVYTALVASAANGLVLRHRIRAEEEYLFSRPGYSQAFSKLPRLLPHFSRYA